MMKIVKINKILFLFFGFCGLSFANPLEKLLSENQNIIQEEIVTDSSYEVKNIELEEKIKHIKSLELMEKDIETFNMQKKHIEAEINLLNAKNKLKKTINKNKEKKKTTSVKVINKDDAKIINNKNTKKLENNNKNANKSIKQNIKKSQQSLYVEAVIDGKVIFEGLDGSFAIGDKVLKKWIIESIDQYQINLKSIRTKKILKLPLDW